MLFLDFLLLIVIGVCIGYSWMLNRRIQDLQNSRIEFARMIKELNASINKAEISVGELKELGSSTSNDLKVSIESAKSTASELMMMNDIGNSLADTLSEQILVIKRDQKSFYSQNNGEADSRLKAQDDKSIDNKGEDESENFNYFRNIVPKMSKTDENVSLNQANYYNTLKKISAKK